MKNSHIRTAIYQAYRPGSPRALSFQELHTRFQVPRVEFLGENGVGDEDYCIQGFQGMHVTLRVPSEELHRKTARVEVTGYRVVQANAFQTLADIVGGSLVEIGEY